MDAFSVIISFAGVVFFGCLYVFIFSLRGCITIIESVPALVSYCAEVFGEWLGNIEKNTYERRLRMLLYDCSVFTDKEAQKAAWVVDCLSEIHGFLCHCDCRTNEDARRLGRILTFTQKTRCAFLFGCVFKTDSLAYIKNAMDSNLTLKMVQCTSEDIPGVKVEFFQRQNDSFEREAGVFYAYDMEEELLIVDARRADQTRLDQMNTEMKGRVIKSMHICG